MHSKRVFWTSVVCVSLAACSGADSQRKQPLVGTEARATTGTPASPHLLGQLPPDWLFTIYLGSSADPSQVLAQVVTLGGSNNQVKVSQDGNPDSPKSWPGSSEAWYINHDVLSTLSRTQSLYITSQSANKDKDGNLPLPLARNAHFDFGGSNLWLKKATFGIATYSAAEPATWAQPTVPDPYSSATSYYFMGPPTYNTGNPTFGLRLVVPPSGSASFTAVQWYQVYSNASSCAQTAINPGSMAPGTLGGIAYAISTGAPTAPAGGIVCSAASALTLQ